MKRLSTGSTFEKSAGYSRMIESSGWIVSAGTTGFDYESMMISEEIEKQVMQSIINIEKCLEVYGCTLQDIVVCNWIITDRKYFNVAGNILKKRFAPNAPAMMTTIAQLVDERMKFEMQIFARVEKHDV